MSNERKPAQHGPMGGGPGMGSFEKARDFKGTLKQLVKYLSAYKIRFILTTLLAIGSTVFAIIGPRRLGDATTEIFNGIMSRIGGGDGINFEKIGEILLILLGLYLISMLLSFVQGLIMTDITQKITYDLRKALIEKIKRLPMSYFDKSTHGETLSRFTNDIDTLGQSLNQSLMQIVTSVFSILGMLVMMLTISPLMTLVGILMVPLSGIIISFIMKRSQKYFRQQQEYLGNVNGQVEEVFGGHNIVKAFNGEDAARENFREENEKLYTSAWKSQFFSGLMHPVMTFVGNLGYVVAAVIGGYLAISGTIVIGDIQAFLQYLRQFINPIAQIAQVSSMMQSTIAAAERVFELLNEEEEPADPDNALSAKNVNGNVVFENVRFGYNPDKIIINDFSASVTDGQKIAIVGPTGAGKTTMVKLLMRFYDLNSGRILVDGHDIRDFKRSDLRGMFGMVLQDTWLYNGTIGDNIKYGKLDATHEELVAASKAARAHHFIKTLPDGYNMVLNEETTNVSQGQKQLLTIARAILADPKILILDEATSSVDTRTEIQIQKAMDNLMKGRTSFIIAHRLSTIRNADLILVMKDGDIIEQGSHDELIEAHGFYYNLYNSQFEQSAS